MSKQLKFESNLIEVIKTEKGYAVKLNIDKGVDVYINGECVFSEYNGEAYKNIPVAARDFIKKNSYEIGLTYENYHGLKGSYAECNEFTMYFPENKAELITARFTLTDSLEGILNMVDDFYYPGEDAERDEAKAEISEIYNDMLSSLKEIGFDLIPAHAMEGVFYGWQDINFKAGDWNEELFKKAIDILSKYRSSFGKIIEKYNWIF